MDPNRKTTSKLVDENLDESDVSQTLPWEIDLPDRNSQQGHGVMVCAEINQKYTGCQLSKTATFSQWVYVLSMNPSDTLEGANEDLPTAGVIHRIHFRDATDRKNDHIAKKFQIKVSGTTSQNDCKDGACFVYFPKPSP
jgi:hypothetical protein